MRGRNNLFVRLYRWGNTSVVVIRLCACVGMATVVIVITVEVDGWKWQRRMISFYKFSALDIFIGRMWWCPWCGITHRLFFSCTTCSPDYTTWCFGDYAYWSIVVVSWQGCGFHHMWYDIKYNLQGCGFLTRWTYCDKKLRMINRITVLPDPVMTDLCHTGWVWGYQNFLCYTGWCC